MNTWNIIIGVLPGAIGMGYIVYGRKQMNPMALISGILLCIFPCFVPHVWITLPLAAGVMVLPRYIDF